MSNFGEILKAMTRKKPLDEDNMGTSQLDRVLTVFDLTALGVGSTLGAGVYVLTGAVAKDNTGPSVVLAFLIAALTSILAGLCYAEFGARVPKAGSGYVYSYVTVGELTAFVIGWNLILSYVIGAASVARAWTANFDALLNKTIEKTMLDCCEMDLPGLSNYPDVFAFGIVMLLTLLIAFGVKEFALVNKIFTCLNVCVILFVVILGYTTADLHNWQWTPEEIQEYMLNQSRTKNASFHESGMSFVNDSEFNHTEHGGPYGYGGFFPYGLPGLLSGTATCFYAFVGFDCIATTGEEAINPQKSIPLGIVLSLAICCVAYLGISSALTLMQPYFLLDKDAPLPYAFTYVGLDWAAYPVSVGAICALSTSLLGAMFPMPRIIYAMAMDGLLFKFLATVHEKTKTPLIATLISGACAGVMAVLFDLKALVDLMSIGTLAAYTLVAASVLLLRYQPDFRADYAAASKAEMDANAESSTNMLVNLVNPKLSVPTNSSSSIVNWCLTIITLATCACAIALRTGGEWINIVIACVGVVVIVGSTIVIGCQPQSTKVLSFKVPFVPLVPIINMAINIFLMIQLDAATWYKMAIWMFLGFLIYFCYGVRHSIEGLEPGQEMMKLDQRDDHTEKA